VTLLLPDPAIFLYTYIRKEAVLSSQIEGTQSSLSDLLLFELETVPGVPMDDVREVSCYVAALEHGLKRLQEGLPLSIRLLTEIHGVLLAQGRGNTKEPGELRRSQNWIGGTRPGNARFVPPPHDRVMELLGTLELFLHGQPEPTPVLIKAALAHVQFETIHPFLDGNGRLGRLLITFLLCAEGVLRLPLLYLSIYFKQNRPRYYELLQAVRDTGDWEEWLRFFLRGVRDTAEQAVACARELHALFEADRARIQAAGRIAGSALRVHHALQQHVALSAARAAKLAGMTTVTVNRVFAVLIGLGIVREVTGGQYGRIYVYNRMLALLNAGTERPETPA
jgi:Fic family protein